MSYHPAKCTMYIFLNFPKTIDVTDRWERWVDVREHLVEIGLAANLAEF